MVTLSVSLSVCLSGSGNGDIAAMSPGYSALNSFVMTKCPGGSGGLGMSEGAESPAALQVKGDQCMCVYVHVRKGGNHGSVRDFRASGPHRSKKHVSSS